MSRPAEGSDQTPPEQVATLASADGRARAGASAALLRGGAPARAALERAGAKALAGLSPSRMDAVYTVLAKARTAPHRDDSLGLIVEPGTTREQVVEMGRRHGFALELGVSPDQAVRPNCYVRLLPGSTLEGVTASLLTRESAIVSVTLNFVDGAR